jgi:phosphatidylinositol-3-phosphatase
MVAVIVLENTSYESVIGTSNMPFLNSQLPTGALATQYFADIHPSIGNYFMLTTGQTLTTETGNSDAFSGSVSDDNIVRRLVAAAKTWKGYFQSIPSAGYTGNDVYPYIKHHDPMSYFTDVTQNSAQAANLVPLTQLAADENANTLPNFMFIVPDNEHNAHDCPAGPTATCTLTDKLAAADAFLSANVPTLLNQATFKQSGVLFVVFDEGAEVDVRNIGGHVVMLALGTHAKAGAQSAMMYQHQNALRTFSDLLGVTAPGTAASASAMSDLLQ